MRQRRFKIKLAKTFSSIVLLLTAFSVFSVGFSSWVIVQEGGIFQEVEGSFNVGNVVNIGDILEYTNDDDDFKIPKIGPQGFITDDTLHDTFDYSISFSVKILNGLDIYLDGNTSFKITISLSTGMAANIFMEAYLQSPSNSLQSSLPNQSSETQVSTNTDVPGLFKTTINFENSSLLNGTDETITFKLTYHYKYHINMYSENIATSWVLRIQTGIEV